MQGRQRIGMIIINIKNSDLNIKILIVDDGPDIILLSTLVYKQWLLTMALKLIRTMIHY
jgi:hypothetical protein